MRAASVSSEPPAGKTFAIALTLLIALAVGQVLAVLVIAAARSRVAVEAATRPSVTVVPNAVATPMPAPSVAQVPATVAVAPPAIARPSPPPPPTSNVDRLVAEAKLLREHGDTNTALAKLQEASSIDPRNLTVLAEMALTYESMQLFERANDTWRRVEIAGPAAGALFALAELKLRAGMQPRAAASPGIVAVPGAEQAPTQDVEGIPEGSNFGIIEATPTEENDPAAEMKLTLRVAVKVRPNTQVDHTKVKIQVFFYDVVDDDQVLLTDADVSYAWVTPSHNWTETNTEILDVTYYRPKPEASSPPSTPPPAAAPAMPPPSAGTTKGRKGRGKKAEPTFPIPSDAGLLPTRDSGHRKYLGYIVRVYYKEQLQSVRADPTRLLNLFPPPFTAPATP